MLRQMNHQIVLVQNRRERRRRRKPRPLWNRHLEDGIMYQILGKCSYRNYISIIIIMHGIFIIHTMSSYYSLFSVSTNFHLFSLQSIGSG